MFPNDTEVFLSELAKTHQFKRLLNKLHLPKLSDSSNTLLNVMYAKIRMSFKEYETKKTFILKTLKKEATLKKTVEFNVIPQPLTEIIDRVCVLNYSFSIRLPLYKSGSERVLKIFICAPAHYTTTKIKNMIGLISTWFIFVNDFVDNGCSNFVDIYLYLIPNKKNMPEHSEIIDREHVNTAFTTTCALKTNVHIFREEEWFRALIHESFHNLGLDFITMGDTAIIKEEERINAAFHTTIPEIRLYETYCEMWAEVLNLLFYVFINNSPDTNSPHWKVDFLRFLKYEQAFSLLQCVKIMNHNKMSYSTMDTQFKENSNCFSYYVLKCILSVHLDDFLHFCSTQFDEGVYSLQFCKTQSNLKKYTSLIIRNHKSSKMKETTMWMENADISHIGLKKTLRMSLFEIIC